MHVPAAAVVTAEPDTVHTGGVSELNVTASPEVADADKVTGAPTLAAGGWLKAIVCGCFPAWTSNLRVTSGAGAKRALPPCEAVIVHVPGAAVVTAEPDTVHAGGVSEVNVTGNPEVADADNVTGTPTLAARGWLKAIACDLRPAWTWNERVTPGAAAKRALPPCEAVTVHAPGATVVTADPDTVHTSGVSEANDTGNPEVADADNVTGTPTLAAGGWLKAIACDLRPGWTSNARASPGAGAKIALPPCEAVTVHVPGATVVTVRPDTVHTSGVPELNDTGNPEVADADKVTGTPTAVPGGGAKKISCPFCPAFTEKDSVTPEAGA